MDNEGQGGTVKVLALGSLPVRTYLVLNKVLVDSSACVLESYRRLMGASDLLRASLVKCRLLFQLLSDKHI